MNDLKRNASIDTLKCICAVLVVLLHTDFKGHNFILPFTRCAVPCFFIISGYLLFKKDGIGKERLIRNLKNILHIIIWTTLLFIVVKETTYIKLGQLFVPSIMQWFDFLVFNENPFSGHLWYLSAYMYVLLIMLMVDKHSKWKLMLYITPLLLFVDLFFGKYSLLLLNKEFPYIYVRNFLFVGIPYFIIGVWIKKNSSKLLSVNRYIYAGG